MISYEVWSLFGGLAMFAGVLFFVIFWWVDPTSHGFLFFSSPKKIPYILLIFPRLVWYPFSGADPGQL